MGTAQSPAAMECATAAEWGEDKGEGGKIIEVELLEWTHNGLSPKKSADSMKGAFSIVNSRCDNFVKYYTFLLFPL